MKKNWLSLFGNFGHKDQQITFKGKTEEFDGLKGKEKVPSLGHYLCEQSFQNGKITTEIEFSEVDEQSACEMMLYYDPNTKFMFNAGIGGGGGMFAIRYFNGKTWYYHVTSGDRRNLEAKKKYRTEVSVVGSRIILTINGVKACSTDLPFPLPVSQVGIWCMASSNITISEPDIIAINPKVFVIMQFSEPYNELYHDVIKKVCEKEFDLDVKRADETYGPGIIIADIKKDIKEAQVVIAEITPINANVYYEVGYADALNKPIILVADKNTKLPFDLHPSRTLYYENSIGGKSKVEESLRKYLKTILNQGIPNNSIQRTDTAA